MQLLEPYSRLIVETLYYTIEEFDVTADVTIKS